MTAAPINVERIILQLPILVKIKKAAPSKIKKVDVSPTEPGIKPKNISQLEYTIS